MYIYCVRSSDEGTRLCVLVLESKTLVLLHHNVLILIHHQKKCGVKYLLEVRRFVNFRLFVSDRV